MDKLQGYYKHYGADILYVNDIEAEHSFPTDLAQNKNACDYLGAPYINNCDYDGVGQMFNHIIPGQDTKPLKKRNLDWKSTGTLSKFEQAEFVEDLYVFSTSGFDDLGYVFVPNTCQGGDSPQCKVHVALHGCEQGRGTLDTEYVENTGYMEWAGVNDIIVLFPQAKKTAANPKGCWDWWGYTGADYASKVGVQPKAISRMVDRLSTASASSAMTSSGLLGSSSSLAMWEPAAGHFNFDSMMSDMLAMWMTLFKFFFW
uniref:Uncharacterized protein n=1 Tax=Strombidium inclinatum TaxID=197538 RepID=A0A7S3MV40_9SPIT|mmetsp:Transcript_18587/g.28545  ORF Transcript_18587/g.28545 Transcript_18587/m.28545 type:complete len:258 (+) Transcript_18587:402-1175(+)|eukprot:CAMPEP_0170484378 /NCGR_PEP_ID=MMETSP0208-20121228/3859_1 /TAXON_ID=197538 /ORGANISM="Strombidium inclinatum, Strain S3" /LENGTH=257 /DNA_ID=CAMNT_0010757695 /DNA_START=388 /DNA_END=1161 /DNA_ORIENTATION=-